MNNNARIKKNNSRTTNTLLNFTSSLGGQLLTILMHFITRTVFIATLGKAYLGINGLFSNILMVLSLAEFGVGSAILFKLYEPLAKEDHHRIAVLMKFYKLAYRVIGIAVTIVGLCLIPFLPMLINDYDKLTALGINAAFIFALYLLRTVSSYLFFAYKSAIIQADQKEYLINLISYIFTIGASVLQIICMYAFHDYIIYVAILIGQVIAQNIAVAVLSNKMYPYINEPTDDKMGRQEVAEIFKDCGALFLYKLNNVVLKATDNIVISKFIGIEAVAVYSNYYILYTTINTLFAKIYNAVSHSLGNLHTGSDREHEYKIFEAVMLITAILGGTAFIGVFICADELVDAWIGKEWLIAQPFAMLMGLELYTLSFRVALSKYRTTMGLFQQAKYRPVAGMIINLIVSIALVRNWGISGVLVGTIVADWTTMMWFDPIIIHKYGFGNVMPVARYFKKFLKYFFTVCAVGAADYMLCTHFMTGHGWLSVLVHAVISGITVPCVLVALNIGSAEGQYVYKLGMGYVRKFRKKLRK